MAAFVLGLVLGPFAWGLVLWLTGCLVIEESDE